MPMIPESQGGLLANPLLDATALGVDDLVNLTVPARARWKVWELFMLFTADGNAGNRTVQVEKFTEDSETVGIIMTAITVTLGQTLSLNMSLLDYEESQFDLNRERPLRHPFLMKAGKFIQVKDTAGIANGDTVEWRGIVEEWIEA